MGHDAVEVVRAQTEHYRTDLAPDWLTNGDRLFFVQLYRWFPSMLQVLQIIRPETLIRWHRAGFRSYWLWKSRNRGGRPRDSYRLTGADRADELGKPAALGRAAHPW